ncbi:hypothetical protein NLX83_35550 [Allokutzneria sp. A3M-2-11 16]|uniref:hypothetical protein n=1 Tax=Allokutzneria sp. A3M-2-11 16 TaxID=2962043 RepID=UPI0020B774E6|nr:hypothetical protein [Allokutzneria sp. A3M-2-11 16]MCP3804600.1 hypothetical protein [Allokutzneria sp. A3M-2-11 16]
MAWFRRKTSADPTALMPPVGEPSKTEQIVEFARQQRPADEHWVHTQIISYVELLRDRYDAPLFVGLSGRPAILLRLSGQMRADLDGLGELIEREGANLFLQGYRVGRYGMVRAVLELPEYDLIFETPLTLAHGDVQEFLLGGYQNGAIELHIAHLGDARTLRLLCQANGIQPVVSSVLSAVRGLRHPTTPEEQAGPIAQLEAKFPKISDGLAIRNRIRLVVTGQAEDVVAVVTHN